MEWVGRGRRKVYPDERAIQSLGRREERPHPWAKEISDVEWVGGLEWGQEVSGPIESCIAEASRRTFSPSYSSNQG